MIGKSKPLASWEELPEATILKERVQGSFDTLSNPCGRFQRLRMTGLGCLVE
jgi:hypothetical protein